MSERLYPTIVADGSLSTPATDNCSTLQRQITSELDKYKKPQRSVKDTIITMMAGTWLLIHQAHNEKPIS